ncbi:CDT1-like protein a, chloroplastic [Asparagus officinalis]|nr:CDT1-like protein a, chloroplastic [Asparagus officinalis]
MPEKPIQLPRRSKVAFSVKEVKEIALGLQKPQKDSIARRSDLNESGDGDELLAVEEKLKSAESSPSKSSKARSLIKLPEKYEILVDFFNSMESSIRLLRLKRSLPTFANICSSIQHLTGRRFTYGHLAQLKYILPEAISIKKVLLRDEVTCCMMPVLQLYLQKDAIESGSNRKEEESGYSILRKIFRQRLVDFFRKHPEQDDIPEEELPHPFGHQTTPNIPSDIARNSTSSINSTTDVREFVNAASHIPRSFCKRFSQKNLIPDGEKTSLLCINEDMPRDNSPITVESSPIKCDLRPTICKKPLFTSPVPKTSSSTQCAHKEKKRLMNTDKCSLQKSNQLDGTPVKFVSTPLKLMTATPEIQTPKRHRPTTNCYTPVKEVPEKQSARTKLLFATPQKSAQIDDSEEVTVTISDGDDDVINILPETLLQEIREKEIIMAEERNSGASEAKKRKEMLASLPKLFDMILLIFQSGNRSFVTKQELVHKIISGCTTIVDRSEVEQQLKLLQELAPDWISAKMVPSGDFLYSVNKISCSQDIRQRLAEAQS